jgi:hypothetical protein
LVGSLADDLLAEARVRRVPLGSTVTLGLTLIL